ncbi:MAG TPA: hypothetical protein VIP46_01985, partial [Pyrinomonadaceae bacterium]
MRGDREGYNIKRHTGAFIFVLAVALAAGLLLRSSSAETSAPHAAGPTAPMVAFAGGMYEASGVAHVPGTDGVLFVDDGRPDEIFWMRLSGGRAQAGEIRPIKLGASVVDKEGMTYDGTHFYVVGSLSKYKAADGAGLARFRFDPAGQRASGTESVAGLK